MALPDAPVVPPGGPPRPLREVLAESATPTLLAFFKTSCPTCKLAWPYVQAVHTAYGGRAVRVVGVSQDDEPKSREFFSSFGPATFDLALDPAPAYAASNAADVESVPLLVLVDRDGTELARFAGWQRKALEEMGALLASKAGVPPVALIAEDDPVPSWKAG